MKRIVVLTASTNGVGIPSLILSHRGCVAATPANQDTSASSGGPRPQLRQEAQLDLAHPGDRLQPPEGRFDPQSRMLALRIALVTRGASVNGAVARAGHILCGVRRSVQLAQQPDEIAHVIGLVGPDRALM